MPIYATAFLKKPVNIHVKISSSLVLWLVSFVFSKEAAGTCFPVHVFRTCTSCDIFIQFFGLLLLFHMFSILMTD